MEKLGYIELHISGKKGAFDINPDNYDIRDIIIDIQHVENLLFPGEKSNRPIISYRIDDGSVKHIFKTGVQYIIGLNAILYQVILSNNIDFLEPNTAKAMEYFQDAAIKKDISINIKTSQPDTPNLIIDKTTNFRRTLSTWVDSEFYFYGKITNAGGKDKANIHLVTSELGTIIIQTPQSILEELENNILYKSYGIRAIGRQNLETGEIESGLKFLEMIDYTTIINDEYLKKLRKKAMNWLQNIKPDEWLSEVRGGYEN